MSLYTAPSDIHGFGLFSDEQIKENEKIGIIFNRISNTGIFANDFKENLFGRFTNHSKNPNTKIVLQQGHIILQAISMIDPSEEITADYNELIELFNHDPTASSIIKLR